MSGDEELTGWHWRNSMKTVRFFKFDARVVFFWLAVLLHISYWTLALAFSMTFVFYILERRGLSFSSALRALRVWFIGSKRPATNWTVRRKLHDSGST